MLLGLLVVELLELEVESVALPFASVVFLCFLCFLVSVVLPLASVEVDVLVVLCASVELGVELLLPDCAPA